MGLKERIAEAAGVCPLTLQNTASEIATKVLGIPQDEWRKLTISVGMREVI